MHKQTLTILTPTKQTQTESRKRSRSGSSAELRSVITGNGTEEVQMDANNDPDDMEEETVISSGKVIVDKGVSGSAEEERPKKRVKVEEKGEMWVMDAHDSDGSEVWSDNDSLIDTTEFITLPSLRSLHPSLTSSPALPKSNSSCTRCRIRKIECDGVRPSCGSCVVGTRELGGGLVCHWEGGGVEVGGGGPSTGGPYTIRLKISPPSTPFGGGSQGMDFDGDEKVENESFVDQMSIGTGGPSSVAASPNDSPVPKKRGVGRPRKRKRGRPAGFKGGEGVLHADIAGREGAAAGGTGSGPLKREVEVLVRENPFLREEDGGVRRSKRVSLRR
ncbi:hypothetical protein HK097_010755, partial [Rhizophlyctis rosea]